jgi:crotonobetainyl-CoA:carnitine CoA-transferase CaiB-like acyl-CoA transferase
MERWQNVNRVPAPALIPTYGPLSGMRVLLTGSIVAAPFAASLLAEYGAEVIHVERPKVGDPYRNQAPIIMAGDSEENPFVLAGSEVPANQKVSTGWIQEGRNKLSLTLEVNMKIPEAREIFLSLIKNCDVWMENMVWTEKLGISDAMLFEVNPKLVIAHISGFGRPQFGGVPEECDRPSYDPVGQAEGGYMFINGFPEPSPPSHATSFINDYLTASFCVNAILMALRHAEKTGEGQAVDVAQIETMSKVLNDSFVNYFQLGTVKQRAGNRVPIFQPGNLYKTKDGYLYLGAFGPAVYNRALNAMGIDTEKFPYTLAGCSTEAINSEIGLQLNAEIEHWMVSRTSKEGQEQLKKKKVPCAIPQTIADLAASEHYQKRGNFIEYRDETLGKTVKAFGFGPKMSRTPPNVWRGGPTLGQDTVAILSKIAGYSENEIENFKGKGVID